MSCVFRIRLNRLGSIWYTVLSVIIQIYLLYLGFKRYQLYTEMKWPNGLYPNIWLTIYISTFAICLPLLVLFVAFGVWKSGNLAGDNDQIGSRIERIIEIAPRQQNCYKTNCIFCLCHITRSCWQHSPPFPQTIHLILAILQLFAQQIMLAQLYRFGFINSGDFLNTELDFIYQRSRQLITNLPMGDTRLQGFRITSDELTESPIAPNLLPILMHARLFGVPLEFVNLLFALIAYSCVYPSVFWRMSKEFSFCFSFHLIIHSATIIYTYLAFSILFRVQETNYFSARPIGIGQYLWALRPLQVYHPLIIIAMFFFTIFLIQIPPTILYSYGYNKYITCLAIYRKTSRQNQQQSQTLNSQILNYKINQNNLCCDGYGPHISAIIILLMIVVAKAPTLYAFTLLYQHNEKPFILSCILVDVLYLFTWIILWLILTLKRNWNFRIIHNVCEILSLQDAYRTADGNWKEKSISDMKHSLLLMHRGHIFVTDDPIAKPSIMRNVLKACAQDDVYWLNTNYSPAIKREDCNNQAQKTPEIMRLLESSKTCNNCLNSTTVMCKCNNNYSANDCNELLQSVLVSAPPYQQRLTQPIQQSLNNFTLLTQQRALLNSELATNNTFGTLQHNNNMNNEFNSNFINQSPLAQHQSFNINSENYASIHRSTYRNASNRDYGILNGSVTISPHFLRNSKFNTGTLNRTLINKSNREVIIGGPPLPNASLLSNTTNNNIIKSGTRSTCDESILNLYGQLENHDNHKKFETSSLVGMMRNTNFNTNQINSRQIPPTNSYEKNIKNTQSQRESNNLYPNEISNQKTNKFNTLDYKTKDNKLENAKFVMFSDEKQSGYYENENDETLKRPSTFLNSSTIKKQTENNGILNNEEGESFTTNTATVSLPSPLATTSVLSREESATSNITCGTYAGSHNSNTIQYAKSVFYSGAYNTNCNNKINNTNNINNINKNDIETLNCSSSNVDNFNTETLKKNQQENLLIKEQSNYGGLGIDNAKSTNQFIYKNDYFTNKTKCSNAYATSVV